MTTTENSSGYVAADLYSCQVCNCHHHTTDQHNDDRSWLYADWSEFDEGDD